MSSRARPLAAATASTAIGVSINPGMMAFTRIPKRALEMARFSVMAFTPALDSE